MRVVFLTKLYFTNGIYLQRKQIASKNNYNKLNFSLYYIFVPSRLVYQAI